jgi:hypothetical protein
VIDVAIVAFIVLGAVIGFGKGFVVPLLEAGGALLTLGALYAGPLTGALPTGTAGLGVGAIALFVGGTLLTTVGSFVVGIVHRVGILKRFDKVLGIPLGMATAVVTLYVAVVATLVLDGWLDPLHGKTDLESQDIAALQSVAGANPAFATFADPQMLKLLAQSAPAEPDRSRATCGRRESAVHRPPRDLAGSLALGLELPLIDDFGPGDDDLQAHAITRR